MQTNNKGRFVISLDFELLWGVRDKRTIASYGENIMGVRKALPAMLDLFTKYQVRATFATVGFLFCRNKQELLDHIPHEVPNYTADKYSPYANDYLDSIGNNEADDPYHFGHSLVQLIRNYPEQEIATHTFSHYYCLEGASLASFEADIKAAIQIAAAHGIAIKSIVFPRNQYSVEHINICKKLGIISYRGNEKAAIYHPRKNEEQDKKIRALRLLDSYVNITGHNTYKITRQGEEILDIPSSRFLRPYSKKLQMLDGLRLQRIKNSLTHAAKNGEAYHLWWHPHNFGKNLAQNISFLEAILQHYRELNQRYGFESSTMKEISENRFAVHEK